MRCAIVRHRLRTQYFLLVTRTSLDRLEQVFPIPLELCAVYCGCSTNSLVSETGKEYACASRDGLNNRARTRNARLDVGQRAKEPGRS